jgi:SpoVK/Ycf46/Vps4 family AAA+-type ATPase
MVILATNFSRNLDEAFLRRFQFIVEFTAPAEAERRRIWEGLWPRDVPRARDLDLDVLAKRFELSGGHIRNIAVAAAFLAAAQGAHVSQRHLLHATKREYQKLGRRVDDALFRG